MVSHWEAATDRLWWGARGHGGKDTRRVSWPTEEERVLICICHRWEPLHVRSFAFFHDIVGEFRVEAFLTLHEGRAYKDST